MSSRLAATSVLRKKLSGNSPQIPDWSLSKTLRSEASLMLSVLRGDRALAVSSQTTFRSCHSHTSIDSSVPESVMWTDPLMRNRVMHDSHSVPSLSFTISALGSTTSSGGGDACTSQADKMSSRPRVYPFDEADGNGCHMTGPPSTFLLTSPGNLPLGGRINDCMTVGRVSRLPVLSTLTG